MVADDKRSMLESGVYFTELSDEVRGSIAW